MMYDFADLKTKHEKMAFMMKDNLVDLILKMVNNNYAKFIVNSLCISLAYLSIHIHKIVPDLISSLATTFQGNV